MTPEQAAQLLADMAALREVVTVQHLNVCLSWVGALFYVGVGCLTLLVAQAFLTWKGH